QLDEGRFGAGGPLGVEQRHSVFADACFFHARGVAGPGIAESALPRAIDLEGHRQPGARNALRPGDLRAGGHFEFAPARLRTHAEAALDRAIGELDLEGVAAGADGGQVDGLEHFAAEALEAAGEVADGQSEDGARVEAAALAQEPPAEAPVHGAAAFDVAAAED